jgi:site-specific DNA-methyltransferase (adenine-specific)
VTGQFKLHLGDCRDVLSTLPNASADAIVTDPPYELGFMGKSWDSTGIAYDRRVWLECLRVLRPGGHLLAFSGSRTYHRMVCAIEDAGFEVRDQIMWLYGSGFPKSMDVSKAIDKAAGATREVLEEGRAVKRMIPGADQNATGSWIKDNGREYVPTVTVPATDGARQWEGWGTALKPAHEPICVARKPLARKTVAANVLEHGTGALNIDASRVGTSKDVPASNSNAENNIYGAASVRDEGRGGMNPNIGRWPANVIHDGSDEVLAAFPNAPGQQRAVGPQHGAKDSVNTYGDFGPRAHFGPRGDAGSAARFFYCAKASKADREEGLEHMAAVHRPNGNKWTDQDYRVKHGERPASAESGPRRNTHPTVKPTELMAYLCRLVTPPGGLVLDPFMGSGSTGKAAMREGFRFIGIELSSEYVAIAEARIAHELSRITQTSVATPVQRSLFEVAA